MDLSTWEDIWTGFLVTALFTIPAVVESHRRLRKKMKKNHEHMQDLLNPNTPGGLGELNGNSSETTEYEDNGVVID